MYIVVVLCYCVYLMTHVILLVKSCFNLTPDLLTINILQVVDAVSKAKFSWLVGSLI